MTTNNDIATVLEVRYPLPEAPSGRLLHNDSHFPWRRSNIRVPLFDDDEELKRKKPLEVVEEFAEKTKEKFREKRATYDWLDWIGYFLPMARWLRTYQVKKYLISDILAGIAVACMVVPQGMSYANLANLPAIFGLYGAFVPNIIYAMFGSSRQLAVGPVAVTSLMLGSGLQDLFEGRANTDPNNPADPCLQEEFNHAAVQVAFLAGLMYTAIGFLHMGFIANFLSKAVISGFMTGAAAIILLSQVKYLLGVKVPRADPVHDQLSNLIDAVKVPGAFNWRELIMSFLWIGILLSLRWSGNRFKKFAMIRAAGPLLVTILGIGSMEAFGWYKVSPIATTSTTTTTTNSTKTNATTVVTVVNTTNTTRYLFRPQSYDRISVLPVKSADSPLNTVHDSFSSPKWFVLANSTNTTTPTLYSCASDAAKCLNTTYVCMKAATTRDATSACLTTGTTCVTTASSCVMTKTPCSVTVAKAAKTTSPDIKPLGPLPSELPKWTVPWFFPMHNFPRQMVLATVICMIDICESVSIAKAMAHKKRYDLDATQELKGLGLANIAGALFNCYTTTGSFSRSAVNFALGAESPLSCFVTGFIVMLVLLVMTPIFTNLPQNVQGAVVITGVLGLFEFKEATFLWKVNKLDFLVWLIAWLCTMFLGVELGIGFSVGASVLLIVLHTAFPNVSVMGYMPGTTMYRNIKQYTEAREVPGVLILRIDAPIYFANVQHIKDNVRRRVREAQKAHQDAQQQQQQAEQSPVGAPKPAFKEVPTATTTLTIPANTDQGLIEEGSSGPSGQGGPAFDSIFKEKTAIPLQYIILDLSAVPIIDATAVHFLLDFTDYLRVLGGLQLLLVNPTKGVAKSLRAGGILATLDDDAVHVVTHDAVLHAHECIARGKSQTDIPGTPPPNTESLSPITAPVPPIAAEFNPIRSSSPPSLSPPRGSDNDDTDDDELTTETLEKASSPVRATAPIRPPPVLPVNPVLPNAIASPDKRSPAK